MLKKITLFWSLCVAIATSAQDVSDIRNSTKIYGINALSSLGSARYIGMGGSMGAIGGDISASNINPAGTGVYIVSDLFGSIYINSYKNTSTLHGRSISYTKDFTNIGQIGGVISLPFGGNWKFINIGFNYTEQDLDNYVETGASYNIKHNVNNRLDKVNIPDVARLNGHGYNTTGNMSKTNITLGANYENKMYLGFGINLHSSNFYQGDSYEIMYDSDGKVSAYDKQYSPYDEIGSGTSLSTGAIFKIRQMLRLGVAIESPIWWKTDKEYKNYEIDNNNKVFSDTYREVNKFRSQAKFTISSAIVPSKYFAFNVDYSKGFSKPAYTKPTLANNQLNDYFNDLYRGLSEFKIGAEYRYKMLRLRGGYSIEENPYKKEKILSINSDGTFSDDVFKDLYIGKRNTLGLGVGFNFISFYIDIAYQNTIYEYNNPFLGGEYATNSDIASNINNNSGSVVSFVKNKMDNVFITAGIKF